MKLSPRGTYRLELTNLSVKPFYPYGFPGAGALIQGNALVIGEQSSNTVDDPDQYAFCSDQGCSGWLNKLLDQAGAPEEKLFWINALHNDDSEIDLVTVVQELRPSVVFALGKVAQGLCTRRRVNHVHFPHPQYWKRFKSKHEYPFIGSLLEATKNIPDRSDKIQSFRQLINSSVVKAEWPTRVS